MQQDNLELVYDVLDKSTEYLAEITNKDILSLIPITAANMLAGKVITDVSDEEAEHLTKIYQPLDNVDLNVEDIRKALQIFILKVFKEAGITNAHSTPDSIGIFIAYIISRLLKGKTHNLRILDPLVGTANLVLSLVHHLNNSVELYGIDNDELMISLAKATSDLVFQPISLYLQDTLSVAFENIDFIVFDTLNYFSSDNKYLPFDLILHHQKSLKENGYIIALVPDNFFSYDSDKEFRKTLMKDMQISVICELPSSMFIGQGKMLIVLKKTKIEDKNCLVVKLPNFNDYKELNKSLGQMEAWFEKNL